MIQNPDELRENRLSLCDGDLIINPYHDLANVNKVFVRMEEYKILIDRSSI